MGRRLGGYMETNCLESALWLPTAITRGWCWDKKAGEG